MCAIRGITVGDFLRKLLAGTEEVQSAEELYRRGVITDRELSHEEENLSRITAARVLHLFVRDVLGEKDEADISAASRLLDLYDCRLCVNHIAQMYVKGIMAAFIPENPCIFGGNEPVSVEEADRILLNVYNRSMRVPLYPSDGANRRM